MMARIIDGIAELTLPDSGILMDGRTVSNYHLLPDAVLLAEGWKPLTEIRPEFDAATQSMALDTVVDTGDTITATYKAVERPEEIGFQGEM